MMDILEVGEKLADFKLRFSDLGRFLDIARLGKENSELENQLGAPGFWDDKDKAQRIVSRISEIKGILTPYFQLEKDLRDHLELYEFIRVGEHSESDKDYFLNELKKIEKSLQETEIRAKLSGKFDACNAIVNVNAGAGGTESCDWAAMLIRMYQRWAEDHGYKFEMADVLAGEEAGIKNSTFLVNGKYAYGYLKSEKGVHRLVRISPFDANKRRHTSFASIDVMAELTTDMDVEIKDEDIKIDTFRSSGAGGQHVNTTDSAVRITHLPTGIVVACQAERSQHKNRATAMSILKAKLFEKMEEDKRRELQKEYGEKQEIAWGSQIRSYVFAPYQMVKDHRTKVETGNVQAVMNGDIDLFIEAFLKLDKQKDF
ncbi:MAG: peptide chain release factor 2 [Candidatus Aureabacteria bacterium]|nr:peptide chain release factor 2 [Candidatus Auribacterota bacterium]